MAGSTRRSTAKTLPRSSTNGSVTRRGGPAPHPLLAAPTWLPGRNHDPRRGAPIARASGDETCAAATGRTLIRAAYGVAARSSISTRGGQGFGRRLGHIAGGYGDRPTISSLEPALPEGHQSPFSGSKAARRVCSIRLPTRTRIGRASGSPGRSSRAHGGRGSSSGSRRVSSWPGPRSGC
jgi:hypothetical protein